MTTSPITSLLSKPRGKDDAARIPEWMLDYVRERGKQDIHSLILGEFRRAGITQTTLAARLGHKKADRVCRYLRSPANWTVETAAELLFAISGNLVGFSSVKPASRVAPATTSKAHQSPIVFDAAGREVKLETTSGGVPFFVPPNVVLGGVASA